MGATLDRDLATGSRGRGTRLFLEHAGFDPDDERQQLSRRIMGGGWRSHAKRALATLPT